MHKRILGWIAAATCGLGCSTGSSGAATDASPPPDATNPSDATGATEAGTDAGPAGLQKLNHLVVIFLENWSYDSLYGEFDGGEGRDNAGAAALQIDPTTGQPYATLPQTEAHLLDASLPNGPFALDPFLSVADETSMDLSLNFYTEQQQIDQGKMDLFTAKNASKGLAMGYFRTSDLPLANEAYSYTLCDHFFHAIYGGSLQNHIFLVSAAVANFPNAPSSLLAVLDSNGNPVKDDAGVVHNGPLTPDGYLVGTLQPANTPHAPGTPAANLVPAQTFPTIGDSLSAAGVDWAWYSGGWNDAVAGTDAGQLFQYHHQPFVYFANYADGMPGRAHLKDQTDFVAAARAGTLPAVSFVKPVGENNEHPNYANVINGEANAEELINAVRNGPNWRDTAVIVVYDENGGFWDHVAPPSGDRWGPGTRVPAIVISPFAKKGVDSTPYDTTSITALIEHRWNLAPLGTRDKAASPMTGSFDFGP